MNKYPLRTSSFHLICQDMLTKTVLAVASTCTRSYEREGDYDHASIQVGRISPPRSFLSMITAKWGLHVKSERDAMKVTARVAKALPRCV